MDAITRIERTLDSLINRAEAPGCPPRLAAAMSHAVFANDLIAIKKGPAHLAPTPVLSRETNQKL